MHEYAASHKDAEVCGLMAGTFFDDDKLIVVDEFMPIDNIAEHPLALFLMDPTKQMQFFKRAEAEGKQVVGCFHSHPHNLGIPSMTDAAHINEDYSWLIWGGQDKQINAWYPRNHKDPSQGFEPSRLTIMER